MKFLKNYLFLISLITIMLSYPFLEDFIFGSLVSLILLSVSAFFCLLILSIHRRVFWLMVIISILTIGFDIIAMFFTSSGIFAIQYFTLSVLFFLFAGILFYYLMMLKSLAFSDISNAVSVYLLIGIGFGFLYGFIEKIHPGSIAYSAVETADISGDMIYYSFIILTTVGFGDMLPLFKITKVLAMFESVIGILYIAIMIGRLVGISTSEKIKNETS